MVPGEIWVTRDGCRVSVRWPDSEVSHLDAAWLRPSNLPTLEEIEDPVSWLYRVG